MIRLAIILAIILGACSAPRAPSDPSQSADGISAAWLPSPPVAPGPSSGGPVPPPPSPTGMRPAATEVPRTAVILRGIASWYRWRPGEAAAGPALREALGPAWRGATVRVCSDGTCVAVRLTDWCYCYRGTEDERLIDLDRGAFAVLEHPSRGLVRVGVRP